ncbi:tail assembly chaperone [Microbacterium phage Fork]|nr:tail assembly chaperone [Microbacterium phage Fork]
MTEEITEDTTEFDNFSFFDVLEGTSYPEDTVTVALNEKAAYQAKKLMLEHAAMENPTKAELESFQKRLERVRNEIEESKVTFDLRGVDAEKISSAGDIVDEMFVDKKLTFKGADGRVRKYIPDEVAKDYARMMNAVVMSMYVVRATYHRNGKTFIGISPDDMARFFDKAPEAAKGRLADAVRGLRVEAEAYEAELDEGFFSEVLTLDSHSWMKPLIRAAIDSGRPPLELILDEPDRKRSKWDGILIKALYLQEAYEVEGYPIWVEDSPSVRFELRHRDIRSLSVVEAAQAAESKKDNPTRGRKFYSVPKLLPGHKWPTRKAWLESRSSGGDTEADGAVDMKRVEEAEQRAREKVASNPDAQRIIAEFEEMLKRRGDRMGETP